MARYNSIHPKNSYLFMGWISVLGQQGEKRGTIETMRNDYYGVGNGTRIKIAGGRGREVFLVVMR
jgi:hypothetical protein